MDGMEPSARKSLKPDVLAQARRVLIRDVWNGYSPIAPFHQDFDLCPEADAFVGMARFSVGRDEQLRDEAKIAIPGGVMEEFFRTLATARLERGEYVPYWDHTDDFPFVEIVLELPDEKIEFSTTSQGTDRAPWKCVLGTETYVVNSGAPMRALRALEPYLQHDRLRELIETARERGPS